MILNYEEALIAHQELKKNRWNQAKSSSAFRIAKLLQLKAAILRERNEIEKALFADFKKPQAESELTEIHSVLDEINFAVRNLKKWMRLKKVKTPITLLGAKSFVHYEAKGVVLIMAPWNYPFQLAMNPLVAAIAAGNVVMLRPSEKTLATGIVIERIVASVFAKNEVITIGGEIELANRLLELPFDHIFFTGSTRVGKIVMEKAAKYLTSVTLELGGKSPVIVDKSADLKSAVEKIVWGKHVNAGQTCVAPDYVFIHREVEEAFLLEYKKVIERFYGANSSEISSSQSFARLIDQNNLKRLLQLTEETKRQGGVLALGGESNLEDCYLAPTVVKNVTGSMALMNEELFGPILPVMSYEKIDEVLSFIQERDKPLALYCFSEDTSFQKRILNETSSGGIVFNQVLIHLGNHHLPFGGVGPSGLGNYHGEFGFKTFSHERAVLKQGFFSLIPLYYPPYGTWISDLAFRLLKLFQ